MMRGTSHADENDVNSLANGGMDVKFTPKRREVKLRVL